MKLPLQGAWRLWSPDGARLIGFENGRIAERPRVGRTTRVLAALTADTIPVENSPDGSRVLLQTGQNQLDERRIDGRRSRTCRSPSVLWRTLLRGATYRSQGLAISRDGSRIYVPRAVAQPAGNLVHVKTGALGPGT
jgi:hypothetical protein